MSKPALVNQMAVLASTEQLRMSAEPLRSAESPPDADQHHPAKNGNDWMKLSQGTPELPSSPLVDPAGATEEEHVGKSSIFASSINL